MHVGLLPIKEITYTRPESAIPFLPENIDGKKQWSWRDLYETAFDINIMLERSCRISALTAYIESTSVQKTEIFVDNTLAHTSFASCFEESITFPINVTGTQITMRVYANIADITLDCVEALGYFEDDMPLIWPTPNKIKMHSGWTHISSINAADNDACAAANFLSDRLNEYEYTFTPDGAEVEFVIDVSNACDNERYLLDIKEDKITVTSASRIGLIFGADTLTKLLCDKGFPLCVVDDKPSFPFRAIHIGLPARDNLSFTKRLITHVLIPLHYNAIIVEFAGAMRFDKHPEIAEAWLQAAINEEAGLQPLLPHSKMCGGQGVLEKDEVRDFADFVGSLGMSFIPEVQSFGHVQWLTYAHPEIAEQFEAIGEVKDTRFEDARPNEFYPHCYCPSNQKSYEIIFDIIDEIIEVTNPEYVHIGHDEIYNLACCPICSQKSPVDIFVEDVNKIYSYVKSKGKKVMMWSDHLHAQRAYSSLTYGALGLLPKDIIMLDFTWYFDPDKDIEVELLENGYSVIIGNLYASHFTRYKSRMARDGIVGGQTALWVSTKEDRMADNGKFWDATIVSQMLWNIDVYDPRLHFAYSDILSEFIQPKMRNELRRTKTARDYDLHFAPQTTDTVCGIKANTSGIFEIKIDKECTTLRFNHATKFADRRIPWEDLFTVGTYTVEYEDGELIEIPVRYGAEILCYLGYYGQPLAGDVHRHQGFVATWYNDPVIKTKDSLGQDITIYGLVWNNPQPDKKVVSVSFKAEPDSFTGFIFTGIDAQIKKD